MILAKDISLGNIDSIRIKLSSQKYQYVETDTKKFRKLLRCFRLACKISNIAIIEIFIKYQERLVRQFLAHLIYNSPNDYNSEVIIRLLEFYPHIDINKIFPYVLRWACDNDETVLVHFLLDKYPNIHDDPTICFYNACKRNYLDIIQIFVEKTKIDIHYNNNEILMFLCRHDRVDILEIIEDCIDNDKIRENDDYIFFVACLSGRIRVAEFLYKKCPNINRDRYNTLLDMTTGPINGWLKNHERTTPTKSSRKVFKSF